MHVPEGIYLELSKTKQFKFAMLIIPRKVAISATVSLTRREY